MLKDKQALPRFTTVEQIGQLAVYPCSDAAATITGVALPIDGGRTGPLRGDNATCASGTAKPTISTAQATVSFISFIGC